MTKKDVLNLISKAIDEMNKVNETEIGTVPGTVLVGSGSELDSMDFIALIVTIEARISREFHKEISITAEKAMSRKNSPFQTVDTLADYIMELVK